MSHSFKQFKYNVINYCNMRLYILYINYSNNLNIQISNNFNTARILLQNNKKSQSLKIFKEIVKKK